MARIRAVVAATALLAAVGAVPVVASAGPVNREVTDDARHAQHAGIDPVGVRGQSGVDGSANATVAVQTVVYRLTPDRPGSIQVRMDYEVTSAVSTLVVYDRPHAAVVEPGGFVSRHNGRWVWNGSGEPSLTLRVAVNRSGPTFRGLGWVDTGDWALAHPRTAFALHIPADGWVYSWRDGAPIERRRRVAGPGVVGASVVYLGSHETVRANVTGGTLRVVRPDAASGTDLGHAIATLRAASRQLRIGARDERLTVFLAPDPVRDGGMAVGGGGNGPAQDAWVAAGTPVRAPRNVWVHEYVHTRQSLALGARMRWFREASAAYYAGLLSVRQGVDGRAGYERFQARIHGNGSADAVLAEASTWESGRTPYRKGVRVLAALDARVRADTGGNRTLQTVFRRLNARDGTVTYREFAGVVANVSGTSHRDWLDAHVLDNGTVSPPRTPFAYTSPRPGTDADGDALPDAAERAAGTHPFDPDTDGDGLSDGFERLTALLPDDRRHVVVAR